MLMSAAVHLQSKPFLCLILYRDNIFMIRNNNQLITYFARVSYLQRIHTTPCIIYLQYLV